MQQYVQKLNPGISVKLFVSSVEIPHNASEWLVCCVTDQPPFRGTESRFGAIELQFFLGVVPLQDFLSDPI